MFKQVLFWLMLALVWSCAGKQVEQVRTRFIPESKKTVFVGEPLNDTPRIELSRLLADYLATHYQFSHELTASKDFASADLYLDIELTKFIEEPIIDLSTLRSNQSRYFIQAIVSFKDIATKDLYIKEQKIEVSTLGPRREPGLALTASLTQSLFRKIAFGLDSLVANGSVPIYGQFGYEGLEDDLSKSYFERQNLLQDNLKNNRDFKASPESDYSSVTNASESNRTRSIQELDKNTKRR